MYPDHFHGSHAHNEHWAHNHYVEQENLEHPHYYREGALKTLGLRKRKSQDDGSEGAIKS